MAPQHPPVWGVGLGRCATARDTSAMPASPDVRRLVTYVPAAQAQEVAWRAALDGRLVSGWLARLVADALGAGPNPSDQGNEAQVPSPQPGHLGDPEYAAGLRRNPGRR